MKKTLAIVSCAIASFGSLAPLQGHAGGGEAVRSGIVVRGVILPEPAGQSGTQAGAKCDFSQEALDDSGRLAEAAVLCAPGDSKAQAIAALPSKYNAYCVIPNARNLRKADLARVPSLFSSYKCTLSGITERDAALQFQGAQWR
ncbi:MAG: protein rhiC [Pseudomonadota bacterium]